MRWACSTVLPPRGARKTLTVCGRIENHEGQHRGFENTAWMARWYREKAKTERTQLHYRAQDVLNAYKLAMGCAHCGYSEHAVAMDFDHIDPKTKSFGIGYGVTRITGSLDKAMPRIWDEVAKCRVLCSNCHRVHTHGRADQEGGR